VSRSYSLLSRCNRADSLCNFQLCSCFHRMVKMSVVLKGKGVSLTISRGSQIGQIGFKSGLRGRPFLQGFASFSKNAIFTVQ
jgi:hypothetical protein